MLVKDEPQTGLATEIKIVPWWAWAVAVVGCLAALYYFNVVLAHHPKAPPAWGRAGLGLATAIVSSIYVLFIGYINSDAKRRGMSRILWTTVAIIVPNALGIILYFIMRQPLGSACPQCGASVQAGFSFCPRCSYKLGPNCPQCQRVVSVNGVYCPYCGTSLGNPAVPSSAPTPKTPGSST